MSLPAVPGLSAAESCRESWTGHADAEVWVLVRRESLARFERLRQGDRAWGDRAKAAGRRPHRGRSRPHRRDHRRARRRRPHRALRRDLRHHRRRGRPARRQRGGHPGGDRPGPSARTRRCTTCRRSRWPAPIAASTPRTISTSRRTCRRPITRPSSRPSCWCARTPGLRYRDLPAGGGRRRFAHRRDGQGRRARTTSSACWPSWPGCRRFTPIVLPDTGRTNIVPVDYVVDALVALMHAAGRDGQTFHLTAPKASACAASTAASPRRPGCRRCAARCPRAAATPFLEATGRAKVRAQHGGHATGHSRRDPRRRRPDADVHRREHAEKRCGAPG